jgi:omega-amidase
MKVALASINPIWGNKVQNQKVCLALFEQASNFGVDLLIFPEMTLTGFFIDSPSQIEDLDTSLSIKFFEQLSRKYGVGTIFGIILDGPNDFAKNSAIFLDKSGKIVGNYCKVHPFSHAGENSFFIPGDKIEVVNFEGVKIGLSICYDLRFPELYSSMGRKTDMIVNIANWPAQRMAHWDTLLKARAIENQVIVAGVNRTGIDNAGQIFPPSSMIIDSSGTRIEPEFSDDYIDILEVDFTKSHLAKIKFDTVIDRRPSLYIDFLKQDC